MEVVPQSVRWLIPEEAVPCDVFLHFRGQYAVAVPGGQAVTFKLLEKLAKMQSPCLYVRKGDLRAWRDWQAARCPNPENTQERSRERETDLSQRYGNKRAEFLSYAQKSLNKKVDDSALDTALAEATIALQKVVRLASLDWYFQQFHEPPDLFHHNARVAYSLAVFCTLHSVARDRELDSLVYSTVIHELEGDPRENLKTVVSQQTLAQLEKKKHPVPKEATELIRLHDELCSGRGFPANRKQIDIPRPVRAFTLFNHFDHYRLQSTGTRRARFDRTKQLMDARAGDYDKDMLPLFWNFWSQQVEAIT